MELNFWDNIYQFFLHMSPSVDLVFFKPDLWNSWRTLNLQGGWMQTLDKNCYSLRKREKVPEKLEQLGAREVA